MLIGTDQELFLARSANGLVTVEPAGKSDTGHVFAIDDLAGAGVLIGGFHGLFLARRASGLASVEPAGNVLSG